MIRSLLSRSVLASLVLFPATIQGQTISFQAEAQPVPKLIQSINEKFKTDYTASRSMEADIVCVQVTDVELSELLAKIAEVTAASWVRRGNTVSLEPSVKLRNDEAKAEIEFKKSSYKGQLANYKRVWERQSIDPKFADQLPLNEIAGQSPWTTKVFAISPTRQQLRLKQTIPNLMGTKWTQSNRRNNRGTVGPYEDLHLVSRENNNRTQVSLEATDASGRVISTTTMSLRSATNFPRVTVPDMIDENKVITVSPLQRGFAKLWSRPAQAMSSDTPLYIMNALAIDASLRPEVEKLIDDPVQREPLSIFVSPVLNEAARIEGRDLVALLPDSALGLGNYVDQARVMDSESALDYLKGSAIQLQESDGWTLLTPLLPKQSRNDRMDRKAMQALVRDVKNTGAVDPVALTDSLPKAAKARTDLIDGYIGYYDIGVAGSIKTAYSNQFSTYRALATVPRQFLIEALNGNSVVVDRMNGSGMKAVTEDIFNRRLPVSLMQQGAGPTRELTTSLALAQLGHGETQFLSRSTYIRPIRLSPPIEVTDLLPLGATALNIEIGVNSSRMIQCRNLERALVMRTSVTQMAVATANAEIGKTNRRTDGLFACDEFMAVDRKSWSITYRLHDGMFASTLITWLEPDVKSGWTSFNSLDPSFVELYDRTLKRARVDVQKQNESQSRRRRGNGRIPPPQ